MWARFYEQLQWGHAFADVETVGGVAQAYRVKGQLQWGHAFADVETALL
jgi:hypothetical protein